MSNDKLDFEWTVEDVDRAFFDAAKRDEGNKAKLTKPNLLEMLRTGNKLGKVNTGKKE